MGIYEDIDGKVGGLNIFVQPFFCEKFIQPDLPDQLVAGRELLFTADFF